MRLLETEDFIVDTCGDCDVPGYIVVSAKPPIASLAQLAPAAARELGGILAFAVRAVEASVSPQRVYCATFNESDSGLHFHVFPRTAQLLAAYARSTGTAGDPPNGPQILDWARRTLRGSSSSTSATVAATLLSIFKTYEHSRRDA